MTKGKQTPEMQRIADAHDEQRKLWLATKGMGRQESQDYFAMAKAELEQRKGQPTPSRAVDKERDR